MRVLLHAGFHKTATTSAQNFLHENRALIWPHAALALPARLRPVSHAVFAHAAAPGPATLAAVTEAMWTFLRPVATNPRRALIASGENLLGPMPRGQQPEPYPHAVTLLQAIGAAFARLDWPCQITLYLSTRAQPGWEESLWAHHARKNRADPFTDDLADFRGKVGRVPLLAQLAQIRAGLTPPGGAPATDPPPPPADPLPAGPHLPAMTVLHHDLAALSQMPFGPGQPFLDFLSLPAHKARAFRAVGRGNVSLPPEVSAQMIVLNRSGLDAGALAAAKQALHREALRQRAQRPDTSRPARPDAGAAPGDTDAGEADP